jgi:hypothetical protein
MQHPERSKCGRRRKSASVVSGQFITPRGGSKKCSTFFSVGSRFLTLF